VLEALRSIDHSLFEYVNSLAGRSEPADRFVELITHNYLFKGLLFMALFWGFWYSGDRFGTDTKEKLLAILFAATAAILLGRSLAVLGPFRLRPMHAPGLPFNQPFNQSPTAFVGWSSMPSDNAMLHFALATGFCLVSRGAGVVAILFTVAVVSLPRVYLGFHYPSDIFVGAVMGAAVVLILVPLLTRLLVRERVMDRVASYQYLLYPALFLATFEVATMFESLRQASLELWRIAPAALG
jgi:undecaprenyl-diphosphatase